MAAAPQTLMPLRDLSSLNSICLPASSARCGGQFDAVKALLKSSLLINRGAVIRGADAHTCADPSIMYN